MVVEAQPVDDFVHGITPCLEASSVQPSDLQRSPQALGDRVVPAVTLAAHRAAHAVDLQRVLELMAAVLGWLPRSLWKIRPDAGCRRNQAMRSASLTSSVLMCGFIDQPTTWRLNRSITTARYSQPSSVAM